MGVKTCKKHFYVGPAYNMSAISEGAAPQDRHPIHMGILTSVHVNSTRLILINLIIDIKHSPNVGCYFYFFIYLQINASKAKLTVN